MGDNDNVELDADNKRYRRHHYRSIVNLCDEGWKISIEITDGGDFLISADDESATEIWTESEYVENAP